MELRVVGMEVEEGRLETVAEGLVRGKSE